jgi:tRNA threonylcarbamoyladenosine biosynthesis protein TsaB
VLLAVDSSTRYAGVALSEDGRVLSCRFWYSTVNHTLELMPAVTQILERHGLSAGSLDGIAVAMGPGGFSALRVGMSVVKGLAFTTGKPVVGLGTLELEAWPYIHSGLPVCATLDAGRNEVASALFGGDGLQTGEEMVGSVQELVDSISERTLFCGEAVSSWGGLIRESLGSLAVVVDPAPAQRVWALCQLGWERLAQGQVVDLATLQPNYLRMPNIGEPKRRDRVRQGR